MDHSKISGSVGGLGQVCCWWDSEWVIGFMEFVGKYFRSVRRKVVDLSDDDAALRIYTRPVNKQLVKAIHW